MTDTSWIVVADGSRARIFAASPREGGIAEVADLLNPAARLNDDEIASYAAGEGRPGPRTMTQDASASEHSVEVFAKDVSAYLESARDEHRYERVTLVAGPRFLGRLRQALTPEVRKLVERELDKDISWFDPRELERYVKKSL